MQIFVQFCTADQINCWSTSKLLVVYSERTPSTSEQRTTWSNFHQCKRVLIDRGIPSKGWSLLSDICRGIPIRLKLLIFEDEQVRILKNFQIFPIVFNNILQSFFTHSDRNNFLGHNLQRIFSAELLGRNFLGRNLQRIFSAELFSAELCDKFSAKFCNIFSANFVVVIRTNFATFFGRTLRQIFS